MSADPTPADLVPATVGRSLWRVVSRGPDDPFAVFDPSWDPDGDVSWIATPTGALSREKAKRLEKLLKLPELKGTLAGWPGAKRGTTRGLPMHRLELGRVVDRTIFVARVSLYACVEHDYRVRCKDTSELPCRDCLRNLTRHAMGRVRCRVAPWWQEMRALAERALVTLDRAEELGAAAGGPDMLAWREVV